ncbi:UL16-binding protein 3-like isoform X2 [Bos indicus x Bos taurus]|uniref:ULBP4 n=2 Tax=Bos TaxID=9903 RepID=Q09YL8_BOVIN|nr:UL16-binding protein 3 isoform X2 [Bos taurus]XP_027407587.1 UL16-binding protein 3-like isoform X2 [Bos indicus x Bos taurus]ABI75229.1 ULBP4 [Bos taurus]
MGGSKTSLGFLVLLPIVLFSRTSSDAHSLSYNVTIDPRPRDGQPWCEVQGEVDQKVFLSYDCGRAKIMYMSPLGEKVKSMNAWETQTDTLRDIGDLLKEQMPDVTPEKHIDEGLLTLQARMACWREDNGHTSASWQFGFNGQTCLLFDLENGHWTMVHSKGRRMKEKWENDRAVTEFFKKVSMGDCQRWFQDFLLRWEKMLKTTASPTTGPSTMQPMAPDSSYIAWIATGVLAGFVMTIIIIACIRYKKRKLCSQEAPDRCSVGLRTQSLLGCFCSPAVYFRAKRSDLRNPKSVYQL